MILRNSLATEQDIRLGVLFPNVLHFENIQELFSDSSVSILGGLQTSALMVVLGTVGQILVTPLAAYAMARIPFQEYPATLSGAALMAAGLPPLPGKEQTYTSYLVKLTETTGL